MGAYQPLRRILAKFCCIRFRVRQAAAAMSRERRVAVALFRERALLHYPARCAASGVSPAGCPCCLIPRTGVITFYNTIPRTAEFVNNITMPRSGRRLRRATFYYLKQIARALHPTLCWGRAHWRICFCGAHGTFLSLAQNRGFCANERRQRSAVASRVLRGLLKAEFAGAIVYFFLPGFTVAKSCFANHTSIALFIIRLVITEYVVFTIM